MKCPTEAEWLSFASGRMAEGPLEALAAHLESCDSCEQRLQQLDAPLDSFALPLAQCGALEVIEDGVIARLNELLETPWEHLNQETVHLPAESFGPYELQEPLGRGGMGVVYKAWHRHLRRHVAIKFVAIDHRTDDQLRRRFLREMAAIGSVDSPYVIRAIDAGELDDRQYLVMELGQGIDVGRILKQRGTLPIADACQIAHQAALGLAAVHRHELIHRDIKPSNLLVGFDGCVKLLDLGLARYVGGRDDGSELTVSRQLVGTLDYVSPEQIRREESIDIRADIYSLGCTLFHMLAGRAPFAVGQRRQWLEKLTAHCRETPPDVRSLRRDVPRKLQQLLERMLAKEPGDRPATPDEVAQLLAPFAAGANLSVLARGAANVEMAATPSVASQTNRVLPRYAGMIALAVAGILLLAAAVSGLSSPEDDLSGSSGGTGALAPELPDVAPALADLADDGPLVPLVWKNVLKRPPTELFWPAGDGVSVWHYDAGREQVTLSSGDEGALSLGRCDEPNYRLNVAFWQNLWTGGVGLFFGGHETTYDGEPAEVFQAIRFSHETLHPPVYILHRTRVLRIGAGESLYYRVEHKRTVAIPPLSGQQLLEVEIRGDQLYAVRLNGVAIPELVKPEANADFVPEEHRGHFGITAHATEAVVRDARFMLLPDDRSR